MPSSTFEETKQEEGSALITPSRVPGLITTLLSIGFLAFAWWCYSYESPLWDAHWGQSPINWVYQTTDPNLFPHDPNEMLTVYETSAPIRAYRFAYQVLNIPPEQFGPMMIGLEMLSVVLAALWVTRTLVPNAERAVLGVVAILAIASSARDLNLARWAAPFFHGLHYGFADLFRIGALVCVLRGRYLVAGGLIALAFMSHATMALMAAAAGVAMVLAKPTELKRSSVWAAALATVGVCAWWIRSTADPTALGETAIPAEAWMHLARLANFHFFPLDIGTFWELHGERFLPLLSYIVVLATVMEKRQSTSAMERQVLAAWFAIGLMACCGVFFSRPGMPPLLTKLALHRATDLFVWLSLPFVVSGLWTTMRTPSLGRSLLAGFLLLTPLIARPGFAAMPCVIFGARTSIAVLRGQQRSLAAIVCCLVSVAILGLLGLYAYADLLAGGWAGAAYTGIEAFRRLFPGLFVLAALPFIVWRFRNHDVRPLMSVICMLGAVWLWNARGFTDARSHAVASDLKAAEEWARATTPIDALFLVDPSHAYGWRAYSLRSSFGNLREWMHMDWFYTADPVAYARGMERIARFGIDPMIYTEYGPRMKGFYAITGDIREAYYSAEAPWFKAMTRDYGIDYYVFFRVHIREDTSLGEIAYENAHVVIAKAPQL